MMRLFISFFCLGILALSAHAQCPNRALSFDGIDDFVQAASSPIGAGDFTVEARFTSAANGSAFKRLLSFSGPTSRLEIGELNGTLRIHRQTSTINSAVAVPSPNIRNNGWHHLALRRQGNTLTVFLDCDSIFTHVFDGVMNLSNQFRLGRASISIAGNVDFWHGEVDEVRVWNSPRNSAQINQTCACNLTGNEPGLLLLYSFDQGGITPGGNNSGQNTVLDFTVSSNNGTLNGFALSGSNSNWICGNPNYVACAANNCSFFVDQSECPNEITFVVANPQSGYTYLWDFGDGNDGSGEITGHYYANPANYGVCLTAIAPSGVTCNVCESIFVSPDMTPPFAICVSSLAVSFDATGLAVVTPNMIDQGSFDYCGICQMNVFPGVFYCDDNCFQPQTVALTVSDCNGNTSICTAQVFLTDDMPPQVTCPPNVTVSGVQTPNGCFAEYTIPIVSITDNCNVVSPAQVQLSGATSGAGTPGQNVTLLNGTTVVTYTAQDLCGNNATCTSSVTVSCVQGCNCGDFSGMTLQEDGQVLTTLQCNSSFTMPCPVVGRMFEWRYFFGCNPNNPDCAPANMNYSIVNLTTNTTIVANQALGGVFAVPVDGNLISATGTYEITLEGACGGNVCTCKIQLVVPCGGFSCSCGGFSNTSLGIVGDKVQSINCDTTNYLPCPIADRIFQLQTNFGCVGNCAPNQINWEIIRMSDNTVVGSGAASSLSNPFSLTFPGNSIAAPGYYQMTLSGICGSDTCRCRFWLHVEECSCENRALHFDGVNDNVTISPSPTLGNADFTVEARFVNTNTGSFCFGDFSRLFSFGGPNNSRFEIGDCSGQMHVYWNTSSGSFGPELVSPKNTRDDKCHHIAVSKKANVVSILLDGEVVFSNSITGVLNTTYMRLGQWVGGPIAGENWHGLIDEVRVWSVPRTDDEIIAQLDCPLTGNESGLIAYWPMDQGIAEGDNLTVDQCVDVSGNGYNGILNNFTLNGSVSNWVCGCALCQQSDCNQDCLTDQLNLSTGFDQDANAKLSPGSYDAEWILIETPDPGVAVPSPAVVSGNIVPGAWSNLSGAEYISAYPYRLQNATNFPPKPAYVFENCFCICADQSTITIDLSLHVDNLVDVDLYTDDGTFIANLLSVSAATAAAFQNPPETSSSTFTLQKGSYCIRAKMRNAHQSTPMGLSMECVVSGSGLVRKACCTKFNSIVGEKYLDTNCNGSRGNALVEPGLPGWEIQLCDADANVVATTFTDAFGYYNFNNIPPGTYVIKEVNQLGWLQSAPTTGVYTVTIGANEVKGPFPFGNCKLPVLPCDSIGAVAVKNPDGCCFDLLMDNEKNNYFTHVQLNLTNGGSLAAIPTPAPGWMLQSFSATQATFQPVGGMPVPVGSYPVATFCVENLTADEQTIVVNYYNLNAVSECSDTLTLYCDACVEATVESVFCNGWNQYGATICIKAGEGLDPDYTYNSVTLVPVGGVSFTLSGPGIVNPDGSVVVGLPALSPGDTHCGIPVNIVGATGGQEVCFFAIIHDGDITADEPDLFCCADTTPICFVLPECDPCDPSTTWASAASVQVAGAACCWQISLSNPDNLFTGLTTTILTPGVTFSSVNNPIGSGWSANIGLTSINWTPGPPFGGTFIANGSTLPSLCFSPATSTVSLLVTWIAADQSACEYILTLDCSDMVVGSNGCVLITQSAIECLQGGTYQYSFTILNNATSPAFDAGQVTLHPIPPGAGGLGYMTFNQLIPNGSSHTFSIPLNGMPGEEICFRLVLHETNDNNLHLNCCPSDTICVVLPDCIQPAYCNGNLVQNPEFSTLAVPFAWDIYSGGPTITIGTDDGCFSPTSMLLRGNQNVGDGIFQAVNLVAGNLYEFKICGRKMAQSDGTARLRILVDKGSSAYSNCLLPDCRVIGITPELSASSWADFVFTAGFSAPGAFTRVVITPWNDEGPNVLSWVRVDDVCIRDIGDVNIGGGNNLAPPVSYFPNPTTGQLTLSMTRETGPNMEVRVLDVLGHITQFGPVPSGIYQHNLQLDILPPGVYFVEVWENGTRISGQRIIKQ